MTGSSSLVAWAGMRAREVLRGRVAKGHKESIGVMGSFPILTVVIVSRVDTYVNTYQIVHFKHVHLLMSTVPP